jgi:hypothetical protein
MKRKIAQYLVKYWKKLPGMVQWAIKQVGGYAIVEAIYSGVTALVKYLGKLSTWVINKIASLLGL